MKEKLQKVINSLNKELNDRKTKLADKVAKNQITEDARAEVEGRIEQLRGIISELESLRDAAAEGDEDKSEQLMAQVKEVLARLNAVEDTVKNSKTPKKGKGIDNKTFFNEVVKNSLNKEDFRQHLKDVAVKNSIPIEGDYITELLPAAVLKEVNDVFTGHRHRLLELVDWTGLPVFKALFETGNDMAHTWPSVMLGQEASGDPKTEQNLEFANVTIRPQYVYKTISIDKEVVRASEADGSVFIRYIVRELLDRLLCTIEVYILTGNQVNFIAPTATTVVLDANNEPQLHALNYLPYNSGLIAIITPSLYIQIKQNLMANYGYYISDDFMAKDYFGVDEVVMTPPQFTTTGDQLGLFFMNPRAYKMVGDTRPDQYEDFNLSWNRKEYLMEMWVGGGSITPEFISIESGD